MSFLERPHAQIPLSEAETKRLYMRFHSLKSKALNRGLPFHWKDFPEFITDLEDLIPEDFGLDTHRMRFDLEAVDDRGNYLGYRPETMTINRILRKGAKAASSAQEVRQVDCRDVSLLSAELMSQLMLGYEGDLDGLLKEARDNCGL